MEPSKLQVPNGTEVAKWYTPAKEDNWYKEWNQNKSLAMEKDNENPEEIEKWRKRRRKLRMEYPHLNMYKFSPKDEKFYLYISPLETSNREKIDLDLEEFDWAISDLVTKPYNIKEVLCGLLVSLSKKSDINKILLLNFRKIFGCQVQIANISKNFTPYTKTVTFKTIPSTIALNEIKNCLTNQNIDYEKVERIDNFVKVEVHNANQEERLLKEGINFYDTVSFPATPEISEKYDVIQCFKCQQFWHSEVNCVNVRCRGQCELVRNNHELCKSPICHCFK